MLIKSFEEAAEIRGIEVNEFERGFDFLPEEHREGLKSIAKIVIINDELNKEEDGSIWTPDYTNRNQIKYELWFNMGSPSGAGFSYCDCDDWVTLSCVGSRLVYRSRSIANHAQEHFIALFKAWMVYDRSERLK